MTLRFTTNKFGDHYAGALVTQGSQDDYCGVTPPISSKPITDVLPAGVYHTFLEISKLVPELESLGLADLTVTEHGVATYTGRLPDLTPFVTVPVRVGNHLSFFVPLYAKYQGLFAGTLSAGHPVYSWDLVAGCSWYKPPQPAKSGFAPMGIADDVGVGGDRYQAPVPGQQSLHFSDPSQATANLQFFGGGLAADLTVTAHFSAEDIVTVEDPNPQNVNLTIDRVNGTFQGTFVVPGTKILAAFRGDLFSTVNEGAGRFIAKSELGTVYIHPQ